MKKLVIMVTCLLLLLSLVSIMPVSIQQVRAQTTTTPTLSLTASADKSIYVPGEEVVIVGKVIHGSEAAVGARIKLKIYRPGQTMETWPLEEELHPYCTDSRGSYQITYRVPMIDLEMAPSGPEEWKIEVIASYEVEVEESECVSWRECGEDPPPEYIEECIFSTHYCEKYRTVRVKHIIKAFETITVKVAVVSSMRIIPPEITLPQYFALEFSVEGKTEEGEIIKIKPSKWNVIKMSGTPLKMDPESSILEITHFPGQYMIEAYCGDLDATAYVSTVSRDTEPCCPAKECEEIMASLLAGRSYPKGDLNEVIRLYRERMPVGPYWKRVFQQWWKGVMEGKGIDERFDPEISLGITEEIRQLLEAVDEEIPYADYYPNYEMLYMKRENEFLKRLKKLHSYTSSYPGKYNNIFECALKGKFIGGNEYSCGGYQGQVLQFLHSIKFNKDPRISSLLNGYDYGPIEAPFRVIHQGVVIYPRGTNWKEDYLKGLDWKEGEFDQPVVFDPWVTQFPKIYSVLDFRGLSFCRKSKIGRGENAPYPTHGHAYTYDPSSRDFLPTAFPRPKQVSIDSPVDALIINKQGQKIGKLPDGSLAFEIESAGLMLEPKDDGTKSWYFSLPAGDYTLSLIGTGRGKVHIMSRAVGDFVSVYEFEITSGEKGTLELFDSDPKASLRLSTGEEIPPRVTKIELAEVEPDILFSMSATPASKTIFQGETATFDISLSPIANFESPISLGLSGLPSAASYEFSSVSITPPGISRLTIEIPSTIPMGSFELTVKGKSDSLVHSTKIMLTIKEVSEILPGEVRCDFNDGQAENWIDDGSGCWSVSDGVYVMTGNKGNVAHYSHFNYEFCDFAYQADVRKIAGDGGGYLQGYGLYIRSDGTQNNYYDFGIIVDGRYAIHKSVEGNVTTLVDWTSSDALRTEYNQWNILKVVAQGSTLQFYANGNLLTTIQDTSFSCGKVGLTATDAASSTNPDTVQFDNVLIVKAAEQPEPNISVSLPSHDFSNVDVGSTSAAQTFTISNTGDADLEMGTITITGIDPSEFSIQNDNCSEQRVVPSRTCTVDVVFSPTSAGSKSANLSLPSNDPDTPTLDVPLSGEGIIKKPDLTPSEITWTPSSLNPSDNITITCKVKNQGDTDAVGKFYTKLYVDDVEKDSWYIDGLPAGRYAYTSRDIGTLSAGVHTTKVVTDTTGTIDESDESNNSYSKTLTVTGVTGHLWLSDFTRDKIYKLDTSGNILTSFNSPGSVASDLAWDGTHLWNLDKANAKIYKLDTSGNVIDSIDASGYINQYYAGGGLAWDGTYLWCTDDGWAKGYTNKIFKLDLSGNVITSFNAPQDGSYSAGLAWDGNYLWYVRDYTNAELNNEIYQLDTSGKVLSHFTAPSPGSGGLTWDGSHLWIADGWDDKIYQLDTSGRILDSFDSPGPSPIGLAWGGEVPPTAYSEVINILTMLQKAAKKGDQTAFKKLVSDPVKTETWAMGVNESGLAGMENLVEIILAGPNPFKAPEDIVSNIILIKESEKGDKIVRIKFSEYRQMIVYIDPSTVYNSDQKLLQIWDLTIGQIGDTLKLKGINFIPEDFYKNVDEKFLDFIRDFIGEKKPWNEEEVIAKYNELVNSFLKGEPKEVKSFQEISYADGSKYVGSIVNGKRHGKGTFTWTNSDEYVGEWKKDKKHGRGTYIWVNGNRYEGEWKEGKIHGQGTFTWAYGDIYEGEWKDGKMCGEGTYTWANGTRYVGEFRDDKSSGGWLYWTDGRRTWSYRDGKGNWIYSSGKPTNLISFNNFQWNDLSSVFTQGRQIYFFTDNKFGGTAEVTIWVSYPSPQEFFIRGHREEGMKDDEKYNYGKEAKIRVELISQENIARGLKEDQVPQELQEGLSGPYVYRIHIEAFDHGYYASYVLTMTTPAQQAIGKAKIDYVGEDISRARVGNI